MSAPHPSTELWPATLSKAWDETRAFRALAVQAGALAHAHQAPGQFVRVAAGGMESYFALANAPGSPSLELLIKRGAAAADALAALDVGAELKISVPMGKGYPTVEHRGRDLALFAAGSGITPLRAVVQHILKDRAAYGRVWLYYGQGQPEDFAYATEHADWQKGGIELVRVASKAGPSWSGPRGHVQDALLAAPPELGNAVAYLCGMKPMVAALTEALAKLGLPRERVFLNF